MECQDATEASRDALEFLQANMPPWDLLNNGTLQGGILGPTLNLSLAARQRYAWAAAVPRDIWLDWVLPYASVNEARSDWRQLLSSQLHPLVQNSSSQLESLQDVAELVNSQLWSVLRPQGPIVFKSSQTPLIYDPMSTITFGYASCTGISLLLVDALRTVGVPARLVGTPAWHGVEADGNHNWVEVWLGAGGWSFIEGQPAGPGESFENPCDKWFCNPQHFDGHTRSFAARFDRHSNDTVYPMAWDPANRHVPGVDRSHYYNRACGRCGERSLRAT